MKQVWVTRAEPGAAATARRASALGWEAVTTPLIEIHDLEPAIDLAGVGALAFTSAAGVRAFARRSAGRGLPVFAVGEATARAASEAGFAAVASADGDVAALAALIAARRGTFSGDVLHPGAAELAAEIPGARALAIYQNRPAALPEGFATVIARFDAVLLHSSSAAWLLAAMLNRHPAPGLVVLCLSQAVAAPLAGLGLTVRVANAPNEEAMLALLGGS